MKKMTCKSLLCLAAANLAFAVSALAQTNTSYNNLTNYDGSLNLGGKEVGNQVFIAGGNTFIITNLYLQISGNFSSPEDSIDVRFYGENGLAANGFPYTPGPLLFDSGPISLYGLNANSILVDIGYTTASFPGGSEVIIAPPYVFPIGGVTVPLPFVFTLQYSGPDGEVPLYGPNSGSAWVYSGPPGSDYGDPYGWSLMANADPYNFGAEFDGIAYYEQRPPPPQVPTLTWANPADIIYGTALGSAQLNATAASPDNPGVSLPGTFTYNPPLGTVLAAGSHQTLSVTFAPSDTTAYTTATTNVSVNVPQAPLTITATNRAKLYGEEVNFDGSEFTANGLVNGDTVTSVTLNSSGAPETATVIEPPYSIVPSNAVGVGLSNYAITYVDGVLTVNPASLVIFANPPVQFKTYGQNMAFTGMEFLKSGLINGDTVTNVTLTSSGTAATATVAGSPYPIILSDAQGTGLSNYTITYLQKSGNLVVTQAALTIKANNGTKIYGQTVTFARTDFTTAGLVNGDAVTSVTLNSPGAPTTAAVAGSPYGIVPTAAVGTGLNNYAITYANGALAVNRAALTITATNETKYYGQTLIFKGTEFNASGLQNSETIGTVTLTSAGAAAGAAANSYPIVPSAATGGTFTAANYGITYQNGRLIVVGPPTLLIRVQKETVVLSWTTNAAGFSLQTTTDLSTPVSWVPLAGSVVLGDENVLTNNASAKSAFYRLQLN